MEELKILVDMVASLPSMALWVLVGFWAYKIVVIGSIYGTIKFCVGAICKAFEKPPEPILEMKMDGYFINDCVFQAFKQQTVRLITLGSNYIHHSDVQELKKVIDDYLAKKDKQNSSIP